MKKIRPLKDALKDVYYYMWAAAFMLMNATQGKLMDGGPYLVSILVLNVWQRFARHDGSCFLFSNSGDGVFTNMSEPLLFESPPASLWSHCAAKWLHIRENLPAGQYDFSFPQINAVANKSIYIISKQWKHDANINHVRLAFSDLHLQTLDKARAMEGHCRRQHAKGIGRLPGRPVAKGAGAK